MRVRRVPSVLLDGDDDDDDDDDWCISRVKKKKQLSTIKSRVIGRTVIKMNGQREKEQKGRKWP